MLECQGIMYDSVNWHWRNPFDRLTGTQELTPAQVEEKRKYIGPYMRIAQTNHGRWIYGDKDYIGTYDND